MAEKTANAVWQGNLAEGSGTVSVNSGVLKGSPVTWKIRTSDDDAQTSPEELIAAAHAACYAMALSHHLTTNGSPPERLEVTSTVGFGPKEGGGMKVTHSRLAVRGTVAGMDQAAFASAAREGEKGCPVANALRGNVEMSVDATLES